MVGPRETVALAAARWIRGAPDGSTFLIRQGQPVSVAALFLYLLLGTEKECSDTSLSSHSNPLT